MLVLVLQSVERRPEVPSSGPEIEYIPENLDIPSNDPNYAAFARIFEAFRVSGFFEAVPWRNG